MKPYLDRGCWFICLFLHREGTPRLGADQIDLASFIYDNRITRWWAHVTRPPSDRAHQTPLGIGWSDWGRIYARSVNGAMRDDFGIAASSIAFAAFLSILPLLSLVAITYGMVVPADIVTANIATLIDILPAEAQHLIQSWLTNSLVRHDASGVALLLSAAVTLFGARRAGRSLLHGINLASGVEQDRGPLMGQLVSITIVVATAAMLLAALVSISAMALIRELVPTGLPGAEQALQLVFWLSLTLGPATALMLTYRYASAGPHTPWIWVWPGTVTAVVLWVGSTLAFRLYVSRVANYASTYGSLSAVVVLQLWLMLSAYILLFGAKVNAEAMRTAGQSPPGDHTHA